MARNTKIKIEKIETFEERLGIKLDNISVNVDTYGNSYVNGEIVAVNPNMGQGVNFIIKAVAFDEDGYVVGVSECLAHEFRGYDAFSMSIRLNGSSISRIRIFCQGD